MMRQVHFWLISCLCAVLPAIAADPFWITKPVSDWTEEDAKQLLNRSPWAKTISVPLTRIQTEDELRQGGKMGQPTGVGYDGLDKGKVAAPRPTDLITGPGGRSTRSPSRPVTVTLRWETALPVRLAELKSANLDPPSSEGEGYRLAVYGVPGTAFNERPKKLGEPLKYDAHLKREGKKDVKPSLVEVFERQDGVVIVYSFPVSAEITRKDGQITFEAQIGRIVVSQAFDLEAMQFQGKLEL